MLHKKLSSSQTPLTDALKLIPGGSLETSHSTFLTNGTFTSASAASRNKKLHSHDAPGQATQALTGGSICSRDNISALIYRSLAPVDSAPINTALLSCPRTLVTLDVSAGRSPLQKKEFSFEFLHLTRGHCLFVPPWASKSHCYYRVPCPWPQEGGAVFPHIL